VFAKLLLSGADGVSVAAGLNAKTYPALGDLGISGEGHASILDTRLFKPAARAGNHEPVHRIVAEYGAARHLVGLFKDAGNTFSVRQCLTVIAPNGVPRDELRGLLGWMAALGAQETQNAIITLDPYAVLSNGDPSRLTPQSKRGLLDGLSRVSEEDPLFRRNDFWRNFSASGFFTADTVEALRNIIDRPEEGHLKGLVLELLESSSAIEALVPELERELLNPDASDNVRTSALDCLINRQGHNWEPILGILAREAGELGLRLAAKIVQRVGPGCVARETILRILEAGGALYGERDDRRRSSRYHLRRLVKTFDEPLTIWLLNEVTESLSCQCGARFASACHCRDGSSKIAGLLLDHYFKISSGLHDPTRLRHWLEGLNFHNPKGAGDSAAVRALQADDDLRFAIQKIVLRDLRSDEAINDVHFHYLYDDGGHSGLSLKSIDVCRLVDWAFEMENSSLWGRLIPPRPSVYSRSTWKPDPLRAQMRVQAREKLPF
jgi:hypothetical protein